MESSSVLLWFLALAVLILMSGVMLAAWAFGLARRNGGWTDVFWTFGTGGALGTGGSGSVDPFPPNPAGCALVSSCTSCCTTTGAFALDSLSNDATRRALTAFTASASSASAGFSFSTYDEIGAIFFALAAPTQISWLDLDFTGSGGGYEVALVSGGGKNGCIYPISGGSLASLPDVCWGDGAGPYAGAPVDQIEVRVRSLGSGSASLVVRDLQYGAL